MFSFSACCTKRRRRRRRRPYSSTPAQVTSLFETVIPNFAEKEANERTKCQRRRRSVKSSDMTPPLRGRGDRTAKMWTVLCCCCCFLLPFLLILQQINGAMTRLEKKRLNAAILILSSAKNKDAHLKMTGVVNAVFSSPSFHSAIRNELSA